MIPFGKLAFIPGRVIHSNEILVLLGENYFVERRLLNIDDNLQHHQKEKAVFDQQKKYAHDFLDEKTTMLEIKEVDEPPIQKTSANRRATLTEERIRDERRRLQKRATKITKQVHFQDHSMEIDSDDGELPHKQIQKIQI